MFAGLPREVVLLIVQATGIIDCFVILNRLRRTCRAYRYLLNDYPALWQEFNRHVLGNPVGDWQLLRANIIQWYPQRSFRVAVEQDWLTYVKRNDEDGYYTEVVGLAEPKYTSTRMGIMDVIRLLSHGRSTEMVDVLMDHFFAMIEYNKHSTDYLGELATGSFTDGVMRITNYYRTSGHKVPKSIVERVIALLMDSPRYSKNKYRREVNNLIEVYSYRNADEQDWERFEQRKGKLFTVAPRITIDPVAERRLITGDHLKLLKTCNYDHNECYFAAVSADAHKIVKYLTGTVISYDAHLNLLTALQNHEWLINNLVDVSPRLTPGRAAANEIRAHKLRTAYHNRLFSAEVLVEYYRHLELTDDLSSSSASPEPSSLPIDRLRVLFLLLPLLFEYLDSHFTRRRRAKIITKLIDKFATVQQFTGITFHCNRNLQNNYNDHDGNGYYQSDRERIYYHLAILWHLQAYTARNDIAIADYSHVKPITANVLYLRASDYNTRHFMLTEHDPKEVKLFWLQTKYMTGGQYLITTMAYFVLIVNVEDTNHYYYLSPNNLCRMRLLSNAPAPLFMFTAIKTEIQFKRQWPDAINYDNIWRGK